MGVKSLTDLADEYVQSIKAVEEQIEKCRQAADNARREHKNVRVNRLKRNIAVLYSQRTELLETERHLRSYYAEEERKAG